MTLTPTSPKRDAPPVAGLVRAITPTLRVKPSPDGVRSVEPTVAFRDAGEGARDGTLGTLFGHFAVFNRWTEIDSWIEGNFLERISPGAFRKTFNENKDAIRVLFQHGRDPQIGDKPLGPIESVSEDRTGGAYEVSLMDTSYNRDLLPGLRSGLYGASFRFNVVREEIVADPTVSKANPKGLPERTIQELRLFEFGPVTFPAYADATAGVRSTDSCVRSLTAELGMGRDSIDRFFEFLAVNHPERLAMFTGREDEGMDNSTEVGTLAAMLALASRYVEEADDATDAAHVETMESIQTSIRGLIALPADDSGTVDEVPEDVVVPPEVEPSAEEPVVERDESNTGPVIDTAAPGRSPTPLYGTLAHQRREPWRL